MMPGSCLRVAPVDVLLLVMVVWLSSTMTTLQTCLAHEDSRVRDIYVDRPIAGERVRVDVGETRYLPIGLDASSSYEVRVSFVSTSSVMIHFGYACDSDTLSQDIHMKNHARKLLHAEKMIFRTDASGAIQLPSDVTRWCPPPEHGGRILLTVGASRWGMMKHTERSSYSPRNGDTYFEYDIVLEKNYLGVPVSSMPVLVMAMGLVALVASGGVRWWIHAVQPRYMKAWHSSEEVRHRS